MGEQKTKVIGYVRVSTKNQVKSGASSSDLLRDDFCGFSISEQTEKIKRFCEFKDFELVRVFEDPAVSARKIWFFNRKTGQEICDFLKANPDVEYIIVKVQDRLFRDAEDALRTVRILKEEYGVGLYIESYGDMVNIENPMQKAMFGVQAIFDETQAAMTAIRTKHNLQYRKDKQGKILGRTPFGTKRNEDNTELLPNYEELKLMARVYKYRERAGWPITKIMEELKINRRKVRTCINRYKEIKGIG